MLLKTELNITKTMGFLFVVGILCAENSVAEDLQCQGTPSALLKKICAQSFAETKLKLENDYLTASLVSDAPTRLIQDTQQLWLKRLKQCKSTACLKQQFELRSDDLNIYTSLNQSLTQHYLKFEAGRFSPQPVHLRVHQLGKDSIKIEGLAYRNPNNRLDTQTVSFLAYTIPAQKNEIMDNEHDCKYQFEYTKALLSVKTTQKGCERFAGIYRLYD